MPPSIGNRCLVEAGRSKVDIFPLGGGEVMSSTWELRRGKVLVVEDASTASLVIVARDLKDKDEKIAVVEEILRRLRS
jgi:hypothetical protein